nr:hypothetical protein [Streptomyces sp. Wb2n-11]
MILGIAVGGGDQEEDAGTVTTAPSQSADNKAPEKAPEEKQKPAPAPKKELSQAQEFKAYVAKNGTATEKAAAEHITKVQGADKQNDILDTAEVYTDYTGGFMSANQSDAKLIASAFADWRDSKNGLVTVYDKDGEIMANGNY